MAKVQHDPVNHPNPSRRNMSWAEKGGCRPKECGRCGVEFKPATSGHRYCDPCGVEAKRESHRLAMQTYRASNRSHVRRVKARWDLSRYGLSEEDYQLMLVAQGGCCAICRSSGEGQGRGIVRSLAVDHCHETGAVRGLLCHRCNAALGMVKDSVSVLRSAISYLEARNGER